VALDAGSAPVVAKHLASGTQMPNYCMVGCDMHLAVGVVTGPLDSLLVREHKRVCWHG
jgi:hypothetical protein